jgi:sugar O-acyltransferase (sialic acid O-acetyltransferase NeuD family)
MRFHETERDTKRLIVVGGGGHAKVVISILRKLKQYQVLGYTDLKDNGAVLGVPYLGSDQALTACIKDQGKLGGFVLGVGQVGLGRPRCELWNRLQSFSLPFPPIVSPGAIVNEEARSGDGSVIMDGAVISCGAALGRGVIVNTNSTIEHDTELGDWVHVAPGATVCGEVTIGAYSMIGAGATVIEGKKIAPCCVVGAGATVVHHLTEPGVYVGSPARRIG